MRRVVLAAVLAVACAVPARAQLKITEEEFLRTLGAGHPAVRARSDRLAAAGGDLRRAQALDNPTFELWREAPKDNPRVTNLTLSWTPPLDGRQGPQVGAARAALRAAESDLEARKLQLRHEMRASYARWAIDAERQRTIRSQFDAIQRQAGLLKARADKGEESQLAVRRLELTLVELRSLLIQAEANAFQSEAVAAGWLAEDAGSAEPVLPLLPDIPTAPGVDLRPDLAALRHEVEQAGQLSRAGSRFLRFPELSVGWQQLEEASQTRDGWLFGAALNVPLFNRDAGDRYEARARLSVTAARLEVETRRAEAELKGALAAYERLRSGALENRASVAGAERVIESATASFRLGESHLTDLLETLRSALAARLAALELYAAALAAHRDLEVAAGRPLTAVGGSR